MEIERSTEPEFDGPGLGILHSKLNPGCGRDHLQEFLVFGCSELFDGQQGVNERLRKKFRGGKKAGIGIDAGRVLGNSRWQGDVPGGEWWCKSVEEVIQVS